VTTEFKIKLANFTISIITITVAFIALWFVIFMVSSTFDLTVFAEKTTEFFYLLIFAAIATVFCAAFLNMSLNLSLIADIKIQETKIEHEKSFGKQVILILCAGIVVVVALLFIGDQLSRKQEKERLLSECSDLISRYQTSINELSNSLADTSFIKRIPTILEFLSSQKSDYRDIAIITFAKFDGQATFLRITPNTSENDLHKPYFNSSFYRCNKRDTEYLSDVFQKKLQEPFVWSEKSDHYLYFPVTSGKVPFVLHLSKYTRYGKIGS
jgi:hypothetical protein